MNSLATLVGFCLLAAAPIAQAATLRVGPGQAFARPSLAASAAKDGDVVEITAGTYAGDVAVWRANRLTLRGVGGRVVLDAQGKSAAGKGLWVIEGDDTLVEEIEFTHAADMDHNGAGLRQEGRGLTVRRCVFRDNENGILANPSPQSDIVVETCEFTHNGQGDGYSHNLYIGHVRRFTLRGCIVRDARTGHDVKSRAAVNEIVGNTIRDEDTSDTSFLIDFPNGGRCRVVGNTLRRGPNASRAEMIAFAEEGATNPVQSLSVTGNAVTSDRSRAALLLVAGMPTLRLAGNSLRGAIALPAVHKETPKDK